MSALRAYIKVLEQEKKKKKRGSVSGRTRIPVHALIRPRLTNSVPPSSFEWVPSKTHQSSQRPSSSFEGLLVPRTFKEDAERVYDGRAGWEEVGVRLWLEDRS